jgi:prepilin-type N-terminal cleavage/methylation domain-containing protein
MKTKNLKKSKGMTLIELTVVILVLLSLISVLFIGAQAWKEGSDRSQCILNIRNAQTAGRSYQNMNQVAVGANYTASTSVYGAGKFLETAPICPSGGSYTWTTTIPTVGSLFMTCSLSGTKNHVPVSTAGW